MVQIFGQVDPILLFALVENLFIFRYFFLKTVFHAYYTASLWLYYIYFGQKSQDSLILLRWKTMRRNRSTCLKGLGYKKCTLASVCKCYYSLWEKNWMHYNWYVKHNPFFEFRKLATILIMIKSERLAFCSNTF